MATTLRATGKDGHVVGWLVPRAEGDDLLLQPNVPPPGFANPGRWPHFAVQLLKREAMDSRPSAPINSERWLKQLPHFNDRLSVEAGPLPAGLPAPVVFDD